MHKLDHVLTTSSSSVPTVFVNGTCLQTHQRNGTVASAVSKSVQQKTWQEIGAGSFNRSPSWDVKHNLGIFFSLVSNVMSSIFSPLLSTLQFQIEHSDWLEAFDTVMEQLRSQITESAGVHSKCLWIHFLSGVSNLPWSAFTGTYPDSWNLF